MQRLAPIPSRSGPRRSVFACFAVAAFVATACACGPRAAVRNVARAEVGDRVAFEGKLTLRGSTPHPLIVLEVGGGRGVLLDSDRYRREFSSLGDLRMVVHGTLVGRADGLPTVRVKRYELLALPDGAVPVVGVVRVEADRPILYVDDGSRYWIVGDLAAVIREYDGAKLWVAGKPASGVRDATPEGTRPLRATGYGVIDESPRPAR